MKIKKIRTMKKQFYKQVPLFFIAAILLTSQVHAQEVSKEYHKEYNTDASTTLELSNKYGDVVIESWNNNQIIIDVKVTVEVPGRDRAERLLGMIDVEFTEGQDAVEAKTVIDNSFNFSGWGGNKHFRIDYNVKMPEKTPLTLSNRYGNTDIDNLSGPVTLDIKYGDLAIEKLSRGNEKPINSLTLAYGKAIIEEAGWLEINSRYSGSLEIQRSQALLIDSRYSKLRIGETSSIVSDSKYDNFKIEEINNLVMISGYTTADIGTLTKKLDFEGSYASLNVENIPSGFESLDVKTKYMNVKLGIAKSASYELDGQASYGNIKINRENFRYQRNIVQNNSTELSGVVGSDESPKSRVSIKSSYGTVTLF